MGLSSLEVLRGALEPALTPELSGLFESSTWKETAQI